MREQKKDTNRIAKVNSLIKRQLGPILLEFQLGQKGLITITKVETSRDMKWAKVWISIFDGGQIQSNKNIEAGLPHPPLVELGAPSPKGRGEKGFSTFDTKILNNLSKNIYHIQGELNKSFFTKVIPRISFYLDTGPRYAQHIEEVIKKIHEEK